MKNYRKVRLGDICEISAGGNIDKEHCRLIQDNIFKYPVYANTLTNKGLYGYSDIFKIKGETVTVTGRGEIGYAIARNEEYYPIVRLLVLKPKEKLNIVFLENQINYSKIFAESTGVPQLTIPKLSLLKISLPPIEEQQKIAEILSTQDKLIELKQKLIDNKKQQKKWLMQNFLTGKIRLKGFSGEWKEVRLGDICKISTGNKNTQDKADNGKYPFFVRSQTVEHSNSYCYDCEAVLTAGDGVGVGKVFHYINGKFDCHQRVYIINNFSDLSYGKYIFYYFKMFFYNRVKKMSAKNSVDSVRYNMIADMIINLPIFEEQQKIAEILSTQDREIELLEKELEQQKLKKKALMQFLFKEE